MITYIIIGFVSFIVGTVFGLMCAAIGSAGRSDDDAQEEALGRYRNS